MGRGPVRDDRRIGPLLYLEASTLLSGSANGAVLLVIPWIVLDRTGSASAAGLVGVAGSLPLVITSVVAGTVVDRIGRRRTAVGADILSAASVALIVVVDATAGLGVLTLSVLAALGAVFDPAGFAGREAMLPETARTAGWRLDRVNSVHTAVFGVAYLTGPAVGGLAIAAVGITGTLWGITAVFLVSAVLAGRVDVPGAGRPGAGRHRASFAADTAAGIRFLFGTPVIRALAVVLGVLLVAWIPVDSVLLPAFFVERDEPGRLGLVLGAVSLGIIVGSLLYAWLAPRISARWTLLTCLVLVTVGTAGIAALPAFPHLLAAAVLTGTAYGPVEPISNVVVQERTPEHMRGRVIGVMTALPFAVGPIGLLGSGAIADAAGVQAALVAVVVVMALLAAAAPFMGSLRELDELSAARG